MIAFDFDKTLTKKDTLLGFFIIVDKNSLFFTLKLFLYLCSAVCSKLKFINNTQLKQIGVFLFLKGKPLHVVKEKAEEYAKKIQFNFLFDRIPNYNSEPILIISASFELYLTPIFDKYSNVQIIGSTLLLDAKQQISKLGFNCFHKNKEEALRKEGIVNLDEFYTDSFSDKPVFQFAKSVFLVKEEALNQVK